jgi:hemerythrin
MVLTWNPRFETGLDWQDVQHQELFKRVNRLMEAMQAGKGKGSLDEVFSFLEGYVAKHFSDEERFMRQHRLACFPEHKLAHDDFTRRYTELKKGFVEGGASTTVCLRLQNMLTNWLLSHIGNVDRKLAEQALATAHR